MLIQCAAAATSLSNKERACPKTAINETKQSLSRVLTRPAFALRENGVGDTQIAFEISRCRLTTAAP